MRAEEEARLRRRALARGFDSECKLSELVRATLQRLAGAEVADRESPTLVNYELDVEAYHLRVAPGVVELLSLLQSRGKRRWRFPILIWRLPYPGVLVQKLSAFSIISMPSTFPLTMVSASIRDGCLSWLLKRRQGALPSK